MPAVVEHGPLGEVELVVAVGELVVEGVADLGERRVRVEDLGDGLVLVADAAAPSRIVGQRVRPPSAGDLAASA